MPKRIVDGDALWRSEKLRNVEPPEFRAEFAWMIPLALANGSFECEPRRIWSMAYAYNRPEVSCDMVAEILEEFERVGLLVRWTAPGDKQWGYWVGISKPGRLPGASRRGTHELCGLEPPAELLAMAGHGAKEKIGLVYFIRARACARIKIGWTAGDDAMPRLRMLQTGSPDILELVGAVRARQSLEGHLHAKFARLRMVGEWFTEDAEILDELAALQANGGPPVNHKDAIGQPLVAIGSVNGRLGLGVGLGLGSGFGEGATSPPKYTQADFDERDRRRLADAFKEIERTMKLRVGSDQPYTEKQAFADACEIAGLSVKRGLEVTERGRKWPEGVAI